jgi:hypothetical protein
MSATCRKILLMAWHAEHSTSLLQPMATSRQPAALLPPIDGESFSLNSLEFDENRTKFDLILGSTKHQRSGGMIHWLGDSLTNNVKSSSFRASTHMKTKKT